MAEKLWYKDLKGFITQDNFLNFFPTSDMTYNEQINSIVRFTLYLTIILILFKNNYKVLYILLILLLVTYGMSTIKTKENNIEKETYVKKNLAKSKKTNKDCIRPTSDNPFMNVLLTDLNENSNRNNNEACDVDNEQIQEEIMDKFNEKLYRSTGDIFNKDSSDRQFYTMPNTDIVNDQTGFAKWCFDRGPTCKEGNYEACYDNIKELPLNTYGGPGFGNSSS